MHGVDLAVKESICHGSQHTHQLVDGRLLSVRFELTGESGGVNFVVAYAPTKSDPNTTLKTTFWEKLGHLVKTDPS